MKNKAYTIFWLGTYSILLLTVGFVTGVGGLTAYRYATCAGWASSVGSRASQFDHYIDGMQERTEADKKYWESESKKYEPFYDSSYVGKKIVAVIPYGYHLQPFNGRNMGTMYYAICEDGPSFIVTSFDSDRK